MQMKPLIWQLYFQLKFNDILSETRMKLYKYLHKAYTQWVASGRGFKKKT